MLACIGRLPCVHIHMCVRVHMCTYACVRACAYACVCRGGSCAWMHPREVCPCPMRLGWAGAMHQGGTCRRGGKSSKNNYIFFIKHVEKQCEV